MTHTAFSVKAGQRVAVTVGSVSIYERLRSMNVDLPSALEATATDEYRMIDGRRMRRFVDVRPPVPEVGNEVWLDDGPPVPSAGDLVTAGGNYATASSSPRR